MESAPLARRLLRAGYYWEDMQRDTQEIQQNYSLCKMEAMVKEAILLVEVSYWRNITLTSSSEEFFPKPKQRS